MTARNPLITAPPYPVERALKTLGANIRTARVRRGLSAQELGRKIGIDRRTVSDAEKGKPSTAVAVYAGLLWTLGLVDQLIRRRRPCRRRRRPDPGACPRAQARAAHGGARQ